MLKRGDNLQIEGDAVDLEVVATTGIFNAEIVSQQENKIKLKFDLINFTGIQPDVRYAVELREKRNEDGSSNATIDKRVYKKVVNLEAEDVAHQEIDYEAPEYLKGTFELWIVAENKSGLMLGVSDVGEVNLIGNGTPVLTLSECYLNIENDKLDLQYFLLQWVDIDPSETLKITCSVKNNTNTKRDVNAQFQIYKRTVFGDEVKVPNNKQQISLQPMEERNVVITVPKPQDAQAYRSMLSLVDAQENILSNSIRFHWVLAGHSGTIQNVKLDKESYEVGDDAYISLGSRVL